MRKVSLKIAEAFKARKPASLQNTHTDGNAFYLHGNKIAEWRQVCSCHDTVELWISSAGWNTPTTRERLNAILWLIAPGSRVHRKAYTLHLNNKPWDGSWIKVL